MNKRWAVYKAKAWSADIVGRSNTKAGANRIADRILQRERDDLGAAVSVLYVLEPDGEGACDWGAMQRNDAAVEDAQERAYEDNEARRIGLI